jgi:hypothetical protein
MILLCGFVALCEVLLPLRLRGFAWGNGTHKKARPAAGWAGGAGFVVFSGAWGQLPLPILITVPVPAVREPAALLPADSATAAALSVPAKAAAPTCAVAAVLPVSFAVIVQFVAESKVTEAFLAVANVVSADAYAV